MISIYYLTQDSSARQRTLLFSVFAGIVSGAVAQLAGISTSVAVGICVLAVAAVEIGAALGYARSRHLTDRDAVVLPIRRYVIRVALSSTGIFILALLRAPRIEAGFVDRRLREMTGEDPIPFDKVDALVSLAIQNDIPIPKKSIAAAKLLALRAAAKASFNATLPSTSSASDTLAHLEAYTVYDAAAVSLRLSSAVFLPAKTYVLYGPIYGRSNSQLGESRDGTLLDVEFKSTDVPFKQTKPTPAVLNYWPSIWSDALIARQTATGQNLPLSDAPEFVRKAPENRSYKLVILDVTILSLRQTLDELTWVDVLFDRCSITYNDGALQLDRVTFRDCEFSVSDERVLNYIRSQQGSPVTIKRP
jgi:hypothetical protein